MGSKMISLILTVIVILSVFAGCGGSAGDNSSKNITESSNEPGGNQDTEDTKGNEIIDIDDNEPGNPVGGSTKKGGGTGSTTKSGNSDKQTGGSGQKFPGRATNLNGRTIRIATYYMEPNDSSEVGRRAKKIYEQIEKKLNCKIVFDSKITDEQMSASIMSGNPKAEIWFADNHNEYINQYVGKLIQPLAALQTVDFNDTTKYSAATQLGNINGEYYGVSPLTNGSTGGSAWVYNVLFFNQSILSAAGYSPETMYRLRDSGEWTWSKFEEIAKKVTTGSTYAINDSDLYFYNGLLASNNTAWVEMQDGVLKFSGGNAKNQEVLNFYTKLVKNKYMKVEPDNQISLKDMAEFNAGKTAFYAHPVWAVQHRLNNTSAFKWGIMPMPKSPSAKDYVADSSWVSFYTIPRGVTKANEPLTVIDEIMGNPLFTREEDEAQYVAFYTPFLKDQGSLKTILMLRTKERQSWSGAMSGIKLDFGSSYSWYPKVGQIANGASLKATVDSVSTQYETLLKDIFVKK